jgi:hypothetical protein
MLDVAVFLAVVLATVFGSAGMGKLIGGGTTQDHLIALLEGAVALCVLVPPVRLVGALAAAFLSFSYVVHAFIRPGANRCHCFGERLPSTSLTGQRWRNATLAIVSTSCTAAILMAASDSVATSLFDYLGGVALGGFVISVPWVLDWLQSAKRPQVGL